MDSSDWANLPKNLLDSVLERIPAQSDYVRFSVVCVPWNSIAKDNLEKRGKRTAPMLLTHSIADETWYLCDITNDKVLDVQLDLPDRRFCGFSKGWLIFMDENFILNLINPFSRIKGRVAKEKSIISLPAMNISEHDLKKWASSSDYYIFRATISADPISNAKDCIVVVIVNCQLAFIRLDKDTTWTYTRLDTCRIGDVVHVEDKFYYFHRLRGLYSFVVTSDQFVSQDVKLVAEDTEDNYYEKEYLVELSDRKELLLVKRHMEWKRRRSGQEGILKTKEFRVHKLDADECKWTEIHTLGGFALFIGDNSSISVLASKFSRCLPNCIYFVNDLTDRDEIYYHDVGLYNIEEKRISSIPKHTAKMMKRSSQLPIWTETSIKL